MDHREVGRHWEGNAEAWTTLAREGYDVSRDWVNTPAFLRMLPDVSGLAGLDIGCGEGSNTRQIARRGAHLTALDISAREYMMPACTAVPGSSRISVYAATLISAAIIPCRPV